MDEPFWADQALLSAIAIVFAPLLGILGGYMANQRSKKNMQSVVAVSATDATTNQFNALTAGFNASFLRMQTDIDNLKTDLATEKAEKVKLTKRVGVLEDEKAKLTDRVATLEEEKDELIAHVIVLEKLVPDPPGPPARPRPWLDRVVNRPKA